MNTINSVLFVCLGNICRSPSAEAVFRSKAAEYGLVIEIASAGTLAYHQGNAPDPRAIKAGNARGLDFSGMYARQIAQADFEKFDLILAADIFNLKDLQAICPQEHQHKLKLMLSYMSDDVADFDELSMDKFSLEQVNHAKEVPDPYYGGANGFETVLDLLESSLDNLAKQIAKNR
ncbi:protein-tyrosine-phosphatase [Shewanella sp. 10N.286.52.C2]|uniref:low molecular weight protein-tyrosine-phosphatase n=1 Tax=unclassified Shewanella TaxID=196818 RepID=UPI000C865164|nr:low molecular weight protein-tyrosine-phosphatase [Shewanella sp. 10N.286.52.C2]PMG29249.1 protein-tyrosine-phosphatase [Shewanella sp. 10N.286.52.C2]